MSSKLVYVAGPYTLPDPIVNTRNAVHTGMYLWDHGITPLIPHLSMLAHLISPRDISVWYAMDIELLSRCDALYRMFGNSKGADKEVKYAVKRKIPVYYNINLVVDDMGI